MSKFDAIYKKIEEALPPMAPNPQTKPPVQTTPQQQKQALEQFAQAMGLDVAALQKAIDTVKQQQKTTTNTNLQQPAV